jgi:hypothetical protein
MNRLMVILSFLLITPHIFGQKRMDLTSDTSLTKVFNETEIQGLESIIQYADQMVLSGENTLDANEAYHLFLEEIAPFFDDNGNPPKKYKVPFEESSKYKFLESLDSTVFNAIWRFENQIDMISYKDTTYVKLENFKTLSLKSLSKYMDYIEEVGKEDPYFKSLWELKEVVGNLSTGAVVWFLKNHANFDFNTPKNRLWAAIFLICWEEDFDNKLDRYFEKN